MFPLHVLNDLIQSPSSVTIHQPEVQDLITMLGPIRLGDFPPARLCCTLARTFDDLIWHFDFNDE
jgi:hypothetical protein